MTALIVINPAELGRPRGFAHGIVSPPGQRRLVVAGQTATDGAGKVIGAGFAAQFEIALARVLTVVRYLSA